MSGCFLFRQNHFPSYCRALVVVLPSGTQEKQIFLENPMTTSPQISSFKIRGVSTATKTQKNEINRRGKSIKQKLSEMVQDTV